MLRSRSVVASTWRPVLLSSALMLALAGCGARVETPASSSVAPAVPAAPPAAAKPLAATDLWTVYDQALKQAKYVDLTHTLTPTIPIWSGFDAPKFEQAVDKSGKPYTYEASGFVANRYLLTTDQFGTQLDPPAHWDPNYPTIDQLPPTYTVRPLLVISIVEALKTDPNYHLQVKDIAEWEARNGRIPEGSVVFVRSDWSKRWPDPALAELKQFAGVGLDALKFLHEQRHILFHGHEPLDTDSTPTLEGEAWLMHNGYAQAEGVANLDQVPEKGALVAIGYPKFGGGVGAYARYIAICPPDWPHGVRIGEQPEAPLPRQPSPLRWDAARGMRVR